MSSSTPEVSAAAARPWRRWWRGALLLLIVAGAGLLVKESCLVQVERGEALVIQRFGAVQRVRGAGLRWKWPAPIERAQRVNTGQVLQMPVGYRLIDQLRGLRPRPEELQWLTRDMNIVELKAVIEFQIQEPARYLFEMTDAPDASRRFLVRKLAEAEFSQRLGERDVDEILGGGLGRLQRDVQLRMQEVLDRERSGLVVVSVQVLEAEPPREVLEAFEEVASARVDAGRLFNEADGYARDLRLRTEAEAHGMVTEARSEALDRLEEARGQARSFEALAASVRRAPEVSRQRLWLETVEQLFDRAVLEQPPTGEGAAYRLVRVRSRD